MRRRSATSCFRLLGFCLFCFLLYFCHVGGGCYLYNPSVESREGRGSADCCFRLHLFVSYFPSNFVQGRCEYGVQITKKNTVEVFSSLVGMWLHIKIELPT